MVIVEAYKKALTNWRDFQGRSSRADYWYAVLANFILVVAFEAAITVLALLLGVISDKLANIVNGLNSVITTGYSLVVLVPFIALAVRRMHDIGKPGWYVALCYLGTCCCGIGAVALIIFMVMPSSDGSTTYNSGNGLGNLFNGLNGNGNGVNQNQQYNNQQNPQYSNQQYNGQQNVQYGQQQNYNQQYQNNQQYNGQQNPYGGLGANPNQQYNNGYNNPNQK